LVVFGAAVAAEAYVVCCEAFEVCSDSFFDFGFRDACHGAGLDVRNGQIYEKNRRKLIFITSREIVRASR
jgi:hypothetical protein